MRAFAGEEMLTAWERSRELPEPEAALSLLDQAWPGRSLQEWAELSLSKRNVLLLELRVMVFGRRMEGFAVCPECGASLEFTLDPEALAKGLRVEVGEDPGVVRQTDCTAAGDRTAAVSDHRAAYKAAPFGGENGSTTNGLTMRPVNSLDLLASGRAASEEQARSILLARALGIEPHQLNELGADHESLVERFERTNASAEIRLRLHCAVCERDPWLDLDIGRFLLREVASAARRLMTEIHELASAYGWSEQSIASMSAARRAAYLEMLYA